ncbi:MAG: cytochrome c3 family protein [Pyrinomonadaceae bacterium]|nr:cytochrome c3 family protein [Pyrinomonadaceae bacterium]MBP6213408.1 cytochrome c3 family protein [Pyrinomonadaceae bacterium]
MIICVPESGGTTPLNCVIKSMTCFQNELGCIRGRKWVEIMKKVIVPIFGLLLAATAFLSLNGSRPAAQSLSKPTPEKKITMPDVIVLADRSKVGKVKFNHSRHNGGEYNAGGPILCIECHHTAQPEADLYQVPPHKTVWPAGRTTTLTAELYSADPIKAGVAACRDCHAPKGTKPKLLDAVPALIDPETKAETLVTNQIAFHQACDVCHFEIGFRSRGTKAPKATNCTSCHVPSTKKR